MTKNEKAENRQKVTQFLTNKGSDASNADYHWSYLGIKGGNRKKDLSSKGQKGSASWEQNILQKNF